MKHIAAATLVVTLAAGPVMGQSDREDLKEGFDMLSEGAQLMLRGLMQEFEPALRELEGVISDLNAYHPPEVLPNGDIIIRRRTPLQPETTPEADDSIEL